MLRYNTSGQIIIGLNSYNPIKRAIIESKVRNVLFIHEQDEFGNFLIDTHRIISVIEKTKVNLHSLAVDKRTNIVTINKEIDLIITYGSGFVHDIAKASNNINKPLFSIEYENGHMSSYGIGFVWGNGKAFYKLIAPSIIFNNCARKHEWDIFDKIYFLHDISLALEARFATNSNDFVKTSAYNGIIGLLNIVNQSKSLSKKDYISLAQADVLMKNAYNNANFSKETLFVVSNTEHYRQFELTIAYECRDRVETLINKYQETIAKELEFYGSSLQNFKNGIEYFYTSFIDDKQRWEVSNDVLGKHLTDVMGKNRQTRRIL